MKGKKNQKKMVHIKIFGKRSKFINKSFDGRRCNLLNITFLTAHKLMSTTSY